MLIVHTKSFPLGRDVDLSQYPACTRESYDRWIAAVHKNNTPVAVGEKYLWLEFSLLPYPRIHNCVIIVEEGDEYPKTVAV